MKSDSPKPGVLPPQTPAQKKACQGIVLAMDSEGRTALVLETTKDEVKFIPMAAEGLFVTYTSPSVFRTRFKFVHTDPAAPRALQGASVPAAARCYVTHATFCGGDPAAISALEALVPVTPIEKEKIRMATKKPDPKPEVKKSAAPKPEKGAKAPAAPKPEKGAKPAKPAGEKKASVAAVMKELLMKGGLTDDQIFAEAQKRCPQLTPDKRSYVAWYRNDLKKKGENPPAPKKEMKAA